MLGRVRAQAMRLRGAAPVWPHEMRSISGKGVLWCLGSGAGRPRAKRISQQAGVHSEPWGSSFARFGLGSSGAEVFAGYSGNRIAE